MRFTLTVLASTLLALGCNKAPDQGGTDAADNNLHGGRGSGEMIDTNGAVTRAQHPGPPDVSYSDKSGTGRKDQGGGATAGSKPESTPVTDTNSPSATSPRQ